VEPPRRQRRQNHTTRSATPQSGGADRDRTDDLKLAKLALSQLSYGPNGAKTPPPGNIDQHRWPGLFLEKGYADGGSGRCSRINLRRSGRPARADNLEWFFVVVSKAKEECELPALRLP